ncbi:hypothetical protein ACFL4H_00290 [Candidatus Neomarinimicrobiota bacterium]
MTLAQYKLGLEYFIRKHPEALDYTVVYSSDDEGNSFHELYSVCTLGLFDGDYNFMDSDSIRRAKSGKVDERLKNVSQTTIDAINKSILEFEGKPAVCIN